MTLMKTPQRTLRTSHTLLGLLTAVLSLDLLSAAHAFTSHPNHWYKPDPKRPVRWGPPSKRDNTIPLIISNQCDTPIWPGIANQAGTGPGTGGFELAPGTSNSLLVSADWQGRVWGRTNCSFNTGGTGPANANVNNGQACGSGDCAGVLSCAGSGATPVTLFEMDLAGGVGGKQSFYDISLVDGYNIPLGIIYIPGDDPLLQAIPPNVVNAACIATAGLVLPPVDSGTLGNASNASFPIPYEGTQTDAEIAAWCPWDLQVNQPTKPGDGVYPYPDSGIQRPAFDPCHSACDKSQAPSDCCTGAYQARSACQPSMYAAAAKLVCPDAYSWAFDDETSTFIIPSGGGWEVTFCPPGRSTNILKVLGDQLRTLASAGMASKKLIADCSNLTIIAEAGKENAAAGSHGDGDGGKSRASWGALVLMVAWAVL